MLLVGASGAGKSTFAGAHFAPTQVLSSDFFRGLVSDDETDQSATAAAFGVLHRVAEGRLRRGLLTVIDATNLLPRSRARLLTMAARHSRPAVALVFDVPLPVLIERAAARPGRPVPVDVIAHQHRLFARALLALGGEGYAAVIPVRS